MCWPPRASIERTDCMLVFMGPVSLVVSRQQRVALPPLLQWLAQEINWVRTRRSFSRRAVNCVGSPFSWEPWLCPSLLTTVRRVARYVWSWTIHGLNMGSTPWTNRAKKSRWCMKCDVQDWEREERTLTLICGSVYHVKNSTCIQLRTKDLNIYMYKRGRIYKEPLEKYNNKKG
jgi:hypothetical protein